MYTKSVYKGSLKTIFYAIYKSGNHQNPKVLLSSPSCLSQVSTIPPSRSNGSRSARNPTGRAWLLTVFYAPEFPYSQREFWERFGNQDSSEQSASDAPSSGTHPSDRKVSEGDQKDPVEELIAVFTSRFPTSKGVFQVELCPETSRVHVQLYFDTGTASPVRFSSVARAFQHHPVYKPPHIEACRSRSAGIDYCRKPESRLAGPWYWPSQSAIDDYYQACTRKRDTNGAQGHRTDLDEAFDLIDANSDTEVLVLVHRRQLRPSVWARNHRAFSLYHRYVRGLRSFSGDRRVVVRIGSSGCGKTHSLPRGENTYWKTANDVFWGGYHGQETVVFDDYRGSWFKCSTFLQYLDNTPLSVKCYGHQTPYLATTVFITSNRSPVQWYQNISTEEHKAICRRIDVLEVYTGVWPDVSIQSVHNSSSDMHAIYNFLISSLYSSPQ